MNNLAEWMKGAMDSFGDLMCVGLIIVFLILICT